MAVTPGGRPGDASPLGHKGGKRKLDDYVRMVSHALMRKGFSKGHAIATAKNSLKKWSRGGGKVRPQVRAGAAAHLGIQHAIDKSLSTPVGASAQDGARITAMTKKGLPPAMAKKAVAKELAKRKRKGKGKTKNLTAGGKAIIDLAERTHTYHYKHGWIKIGSEVEIKTKHGTTVTGTYHGKNDSGEHQITAKATGAKYLANDEQIVKAKDTMGSPLPQSNTPLVWEKRDRQGKIIKGSATTTGDTSKLSDSQKNILDRHAKAKAKRFAALDPVAFVGEDGKPHKGQVIGKALSGGNHYIVGEGHQFGKRHNVHAKNIRHIGSKNLSTPSPREALEAAIDAKAKELDLTFEAVPGSFDDVIERRTALAQELAARKLAQE